MPKQASSYGAIVISTILGAAIALFGSYFLFSDLEKSVKEHQSNTPPVVIVDFVDLAQKMEESGEDDVEANMDRIGAAVLKLREAGFIVLDAQAVLAAPQTMYLPQQFLEQQ
ncbi:hypothetical protein [Alcaligenes faecalis]|uniref:hypothetical protein n=1 Tax=Alcaligenes faecalis TaxID=511 RepID=UPI000F681578|nr:hypothetical protein [Alcaligenes faecalis]RSE57647.1 hypothetical protein EGT81_19630 [Alcaligenes faecalis]WHQ45852.1 hypothetical protein E8D21_19520 [Alcaligenes faecalis]